MKKHKQYTKDNIFSKADNLNKLIWFLSEQKKQPTELLVTPPRDQEI